MTTTLIRAKNLKIGDKVKSSSGKILNVTKIDITNNKIIVLFDGDMEIDFGHYNEIAVVTSHDE